MLGRYRVLRRLGRGGKGVVYEAQDVRIGRHCALKVMSPELVDGESKARFLREVRAAAAVEHENLVTVYSVDEQDGVVFLAMALMRGGSVQDRLGSHGTPAPAEATRIVKLAARGLAAIHRAGIVHRDIKPANIMLGENPTDVRLADFGTAKILDNAAAGLTSPGMLLGTPQYMSPEQWHGDAVDGRTDIWSLGVAYFRMLVGRVPFHDANPLCIAFRAVSEPLPDPRVIVPSIPAECVAILNRATAKLPAARYQTADEMAEALERLERTLLRPSSAPKVLDDDAIAALLDAAEDAPATGRPPRSSIRRVERSRPTESSEDLDKSSSGLFDVAELMREVARRKPADCPRCGNRRPPDSRSGSTFVPFRAPAARKANDDSGANRPLRPQAGHLAAEQAEREFAAAGRSGTHRLPSDKAAVPISAEYVFEFGDAGRAKAGLGFLRGDVRSILHQKAISPTIRHGRAVANLSFSALLPPADHLGLAKSLSCAGGQCIGLQVADREVQEWLLRQVTLLRPAGTAGS